MLVLCAALIILGAFTVLRVDRVLYVSSIGSATTELDSKSPTGYADSKRWLVVPEHTSTGYESIAQTQQMLADHAWRVRRIDYENAPFGRDVFSASVQRWWLAGVATLRKLFFGEGTGVAVERAALWSQPALLAVFLLAATLYVARRFGNAPACIAAFGIVTIFPLSGAFLPGVPQEHDFSLVFAFWSVLPLVAALVRTASSGSRAPTMLASHEAGFGDAVLAGVCGGLGLWTSASKEVPVLLGLGGFAMLSFLLARSRSRTTEPRGTIPWRAWAVAGALTSLVTYLLEFAPDHLDFRLQVNHPLLGLAWLGWGECLHRADEWSRQSTQTRRKRAWLSWITGIAVIAAVPAVMIATNTPSFFRDDTQALRLTSLWEGTVAKNFIAWLRRDGLTVSLAATCLPILLLLPALGAAMARKTPFAQKSALLVASGPLLVAVGFACSQLRWWSEVDVLLLVVAVTSTFTLSQNSVSGKIRAGWFALLACCSVTGVASVLPSLTLGTRDIFSRSEIESLVERDLAYWLADHGSSGVPVILAPPERTASLCYFGGLRGLGSPDRENEEGISASVRIVTATTSDDARALLYQRGVTYLVLPSWDQDLDDFATWTMAHPDDSFIRAVRRWALPPFAKPLPYQMPTVAGFENESVVVLEVTEESNRAPSLARAANYFLEMKQPEAAQSVAKSLELFPADLGSLVARAEVAKAIGDTETFNKLLKTIVSALSSGADRVIPWDRRVNLAVVLTQGERSELARKQVQRCLQEIDEPRIRSLTTANLFRLLSMAKAFGLSIAEPKTRELSLKLLPPEVRSRFVQ